MAFAVSGVSASDYKTPPPTLDPKPYTEWVRTNGASRMGLIDVPFTNQDDGTIDNVHLYRLDLVGNAQERGFAHGALLAKEIVYFADVALSKYAIDAIMDIDLSQYPEPLQEILKVVQIKGSKAAPAAVNRALQWVYDTQLEFTPQYLKTEMDAIGKGICATLDPLGEGTKGSACDVAAMQAMVHRVNMFPELIKMACTAFGAFGDATASNDLIQLRALDLGGGPFSNYTVLQVHRPSSDDINSSDSMRPFSSISYPGMVGVITGVAQGGIAVSEKVWYISGQENPAGSYDGEADVFVLRDILEYSKNKEDAVASMQAAHRTWGIWVGVGDFSSQQLDLVGYQQSSAVAYTPETMPAMTSQPYFKDLVYVDKHSQPSSDVTLPTVLADLYGNITLDNAPIITQYHGTGDQQIAFWDFGSNTMIFSIGRINAEGNYGPEGSTTMTEWMAYNRPYLKYNLDDLWAGI